MLDGYIICGTPRTGSTLLCNLLASTKKTGNPDSFYGRKFMPAWAEEWRLPGRDTMSELGCVDKEDSQISFALIQGSFGGSCHDPRFVERQGVGLS